MSANIVQPPLAKRHRTELTVHEGADAYVGHDESIRTSSLDEPTMKLTGHKGSVYALSFDPRGDALVSGSFDNTCLLWDASRQLNNFNILVGHKNAVLDVKWSHDSERVVTAGADKVLMWWDPSRGERIKRFLGHEGIVNSVDSAKEGGPSPSLLVSGSDDKTSRLWDARVRGDVGKLEHEFQVTSVAYGADGKTVYTGGYVYNMSTHRICVRINITFMLTSFATFPRFFIQFLSIDNDITAWDVRQQRKTMTMKGHVDTITYLSLSPAGTHLLSNSMDGTLRSWDVRPFVSGKRLVQSFSGGTHNAEKGLLNCAWSVDGSMVSGGSADGVVHIWDVPSGEELYHLPGHAGCVNSVVFHPGENVVASGSSDKSIFVGELSQ